MAAEDDARDRAEQRTLLLPKRDQGVATLPRGTQLQEFMVDKVLGLGGHSIVYLGRDTRLDRPVALKEYLPSTLAMRASDGTVVPRLPRFAELFDKGLQSFLNEARLLGSFDHPALLKVFRFWSERGTAYMAMPYYEGITLKRWLQDLGTPPSERWLRELADELMQALSVMHASQCFHRDVAPDNILMLYDRSGAGGSYLAQKPRPVLLDFGAARRVIGDATQDFTALLKSGYSPVEQHESESHGRQGPWTDVYALCAVLYTAAVGQTPLSSVARVVRDEQVPARVAAKGRYGERFLAAIDAGLAVRPQDRPQDMAALRDAFEGRLPAIAAAPAPAQRAPKWMWPAVAAAAVAVALAVAAVMRR